MSIIDSFQGVYRFLSNFFEAPVTYKGIEFPTAEHAYQYAKMTFMDPEGTVYADDHPATLIKNAETPQKTKYYARIHKDKIHPDFYRHRPVIMMDVLRAKFMSSPQLMSALVDTGDTEIVEGNIWHDNFYGDCKCDQCAKIIGQNFIGKLLMTLRNDIRTGNMTNIEPLPDVKNDPMTIVYYHSTDMDGHCCAAIIDYIYQTSPGLLRGKPFYIPYTYGNIVYLDKMVKQNNVKEVLILDVHLENKPQDGVPISKAETCTYMLYLRSLYPDVNVVWVDHHDSAIDDSIEFNYHDLPGIRQRTGDMPLEMKKGACELLWNYYFPGSPLPECIRLISRYDIWDHTNPIVPTFNDGFAVHDTFYRSSVSKWESLEYSPIVEILKGNNHLFDEIIKTGVIIRNYRKKVWSYVRRRAVYFDIDVTGESGQPVRYRVVCYNDCGNGSLPVEDLKFDFDIAMIYSFNGKVWVSGVYAMKDTASALDIAKLFPSGGGRKEAAGFSTPSIEGFLRQFELKPIPASAYQHLV